MTTTIGPDHPAFVGFIAPSERPNPTGYVDSGNAESKCATTDYN